MKINLWGLDINSTGRWVKATVSYDSRDQKSIFEKATKSKWLLLLNEIDPNSEKDLLRHLKGVMRLLATFHPGIILYGIEMIDPKQPISFPEGFWETLGYIGHGSEKDLLERRIKALGNKIEEITKPKHIPPVIENIYASYEGMPLSMIPGKKLEKIKKWYTLENNEVLKGVPNV